MLISLEFIISTVSLAVNLACPLLYSDVVMCLRLSIGDGYRYTDSVAFRKYKESGKMQFSEFGTSVGSLKNVWNTILGLTGFGQGLLTSCPCYKV